MGEITLEFDNIRVSKKEFHKSKQPCLFLLEMIMYWINTKKFGM